MKVCWCSGEKPHVCSVCGKTFSQSGSRNVHMKKRHSDETPPPDSTDTGNTLIISDFQRHAYSDSLILVH